MTKEITKSIIIQEIQDKFKLREFEPAKFLFDETVVPVYNVESHVSHETIFRSEITVTATGKVTLHTIPFNERWRLHRYTIIFVGAGGYTVSGIGVDREDSTYYVYLDLTAGQSVSYIHTLPQPMVLEPGNRLWVYVDGFTSTQNLIGLFDATVEEIR